VNKLEETYPRIFDATQRSNYTIFLNLFFESRSFLYIHTPIFQGKKEEEDKILKHTKAMAAVHSFGQMSPLQNYVKSKFDYILIIYDEKIIG
jgi:hypothetical protein